MQIAQLYIDGQRVDMFEDVSISITDTIKDVRDISKVFTEYSQTFALPASKTNNKIFKHYYNNDIEDGFDARIRVPANIELNSIPFRNGYIQLEGVDLKSNIAHTYRITFFGNTVSLKDILGDDLLLELSWLDEFSEKQNGDKLMFSPDDIKDYLTTIQNKTVDGVSYIAPLQVPLITHTQRLYYDSNESIEDKGNLYYDHQNGNPFDHGVKWNELKYAIRLNIIIKAIEKKYTISNGYSKNLVFSDDFFHRYSDNFNNLYMWLHRAKGVVTTGEQVETITYTVDDWTDSTQTYSSIQNGNLIMYPSTNVFYRQLKLTINVDSGYSSVPYSFIVFRDGKNVYESGVITGSTGQIEIEATSSDSILNKNYYIQISTTETIEFSSINWLVRNRISSFLWDEDSYTTGIINIQGEYIEFNITQQIPEMKVLDFLTSLFKMFNLITYVEGSEMIVNTLDDFYDNPSSDSPYDITEYVDVNKSQTNVALPFREVKYAYKGLGTFLAKQHQQLFNKEWGTEEYTGEDNAILSKDIFKIEIPFEHMKFERLLNISNPNPPTGIQWGFCVDDNQQSYIGQPLIFFMDRKTLSTDGKISFVNEVNGNNGALDHEPISSYYAPANSDLDIDLFGVKQSINFSKENDEWELVATNETLFNNYHKNYISSVFSPKNRLTKITAYLPLNILYKYTLADRFIVSGKSYKINSIETDFYTGKSEIELLSDI